MKTKLILFMATIFLGFNSCKKIREKVFSTRMEGKVIDLQTGQGIPNAKLVVYRKQSYRSGSGFVQYFPLKTFYADHQGNFKDKIKITTTEEDEIYAQFMVKAEPDGYEKTNGTDYPISGTGILPFVYLNLTKVNKNLELKCNPEFKLDLTLIDRDPFYNGSFKRISVLSLKYGGSFPQQNGGGTVKEFTDINFNTSFVIAANELLILLRGYDQSVLPNAIDTLIKLPYTLNKDAQITLEY